MALKKITEDLITWYQGNKRDLPWRHTKNPYYIWISEIMLQQTRVEAVKVYYERFIKRLPTLKDLAEVPEDELLKLWEGLGYYSRVRNMQESAQQVLKEGKETLPNTYDKLIRLPGIGNYTTGAILSIAFDIPTPAIDGNVYRVLGRYYKVPNSINSSIGKKKYTDILQSILPNNNSSDFTQSFMDLGSLICTPKNPKCADCPLNHKCQAHLTKTTEDYPVKDKKKTQKIEERIIYVYVYKSKFAIQKRDNKGLLASMYEFPNKLGSANEIDIENELIENQVNFKSVLEIGNSKHVFSHIIWLMKGFLIELNEPLKNYIWVTKKELQEKYSIPTAFSYYYDYVLK